MATAAGGHGSTSAGAGAVAKPKCNDLSLKLKYEVLKTAEKEPRIGICKLARFYSCSETQISSILKNKDRIVELYEAHNASDKKCQRFP